MRTYGKILSENNIFKGIMEKNMERLTKEQRKKCMKRIKSKDTEIERVLRNALWNKGYRYRKNYAALPGKPDIALTKYRIAVFCDSEFFHGKDWHEILRPQIMRGNNSEFWEKKITQNMERDKEVNKKLVYLEWTVVRFWGKEIKKNPDKCVRVIEELIFENKMKEADICDREDC